jgi:hypothetical protein
VFIGDTRLFKPQPPSMLTGYVNGACFGLRAGPGLQNQGLDSPALPLTLSDSTCSETSPQTDADVLASRLALLTHESPDLGRVVAAWTTLPDPIRRAVLAMIDTVDPAPPERPGT